MHPEKVRAFVIRVNSLVAAMNSQQHLDLVEGGRSRRVVHNGTFFHLTDATKTDFDDLMAKLQSETDWAQRFSVKTLEDELLSAIVVKLSGADIEAHSERMASKLDNWHPSHRVWVPLSGVTLSDDVTFDFTGVELVQMTEALFDSAIASRLPATVRVSGVVDLFTYDVNVASDLDKTALYATYVAEADAYKALELAEAYIAPVADFLQFCLASVLWRPYSCIVDFKGRYRRANINTAIIADRDSPAATLLAIDESTAIRMTINAASIAHLSVTGVTELAPFFGTSDIESADEYVRLVYTAIRVFAEGERSNSSRQKILSYVTACEVFFAERSDTGRTVAEGVAYVLGADYEQRKVIKGAMDRMYEARSSATHVGQEPSDIGLYRRQVLEVLYHMISMRRLEPDKFRTKGDLRAWLDRQRFSGPPVA